MIIALQHLIKICVPNQLYFTQKLMLLQGQLKLWEAGQEDDMVWGRKSIKVDNSDIGQLTTMGE